MKQDTLTDVERRVVEAWTSMGMDVNLGPTGIRFIRSMIRRNAYHEAGHVAARMFTGQEAGHLVRVSIIPKGDLNAYETSERNIAEASLPGYPQPLMRAAGRCLLLRLLAGRGAVAKIALPDEREDILDLDSEEWDAQGTDLFRAENVATIMARPFMPKRRVLALAERWTVEMLDIPEVWRSVKKLVHLLMERGAIEDVEEIMAVCGGAMDMSLRLPGWKRRLFVT